MATTRKQYSPKFKAKVAVEAIRGERTLSQLASQFHVHPVQIGQWRKTALEQLADLFMDGRKSQRADSEVRSEEHTSELQSHLNLVCRLLLEKKKKKNYVCCISKTDKHNDKLALRR